MRSADYWQQRMEAMILAAEQSVLDYEYRLATAYQYAITQIQKDINAFFQKYAKDNKIPYQEARRRLTVAERKGFNALLKEWYLAANQLGMNEEYKQYLKQLGAKVYISRLEYLQAEIRYQLENLKSKQYTWMTDLVTLNYITGYYSTYYTISKGLEMSVNFANVDRWGIEKAIKTRWDGRNYSDSIWNDKARLIKSMETLLPQSFSRGINSSEIGKMMAKELNVSNNRGRALARTEINYLCNQSALDVYKLCDIEEYDFLATLDMRTSDICRSLDGATFKVSQAKINVNYPPMHVNCRSTTVPHIRGFSPEERIARDEDGNNIKVPRSMTQEQWINKYVSDEYKDSLLKFKSKYQS